MGEVRPVLEALERSLSETPVEESLPALAFLAGRGVPIAQRELHGARRRALLLLAAGGDPQRGLAFGDRAVTSLAAELATDERRSALTDGVARLRDEAQGLRTIASLVELLGDPDVAWQAYACALLADELTGVG